MKLARTAPATRPSEIVVSHRDRWLPLKNMHGYAGITRIADLVGEQELRELGEALRRQGDATEPVEVEEALAASVADRGTDIWGAGLNYLRHSEDLETQQPSSGPGSYLRPSGCLIGNGDYIELPVQSKRVTAEAELGLVIGTECKDVPRDAWQSVVAGVTGVLDMTAEDAIRENPRYIPWSKGFDTFCSIGPVLVTLDEFGHTLDDVRIATVLNGETVASAAPTSMKYDVGYLVEYFTAGRTLAPGTVICTGTPGATVINAGDRVQAVVEGVGTLAHPVR
ncbi:fumarylacetoacetate hydrolase family protein [Streptomyces sp. ODS28]|uniref:fumarylacetoacetate hydrolase family protein n=1 Tax=Streptomyces sp. ODS28 TaxID=3136688 RepID=UPI0031EFFCB5